jgi:hypothetical protein
MLSVAEHLLKLRHSSLDLYQMLSSPIARAHIELGGVRHEGLLAAILLGMVAGAPLGYLARRLVRVGPRLLFFALFMPTLWTFVQACVMAQLAPQLASMLPFGPLVLGALAYGTCLALIPPVRAR